jgi:hypothetical protein
MICVTLQDWHTLYESRDKKHTFLVGNKKDLCMDSTMPGFWTLAPPGMASSLFPPPTDGCLSWDTLSVCIGDQMSAPSEEACPAWLMPVRLVCCLLLLCPHMVLQVWSAPCRNLTTRSAPYSDCWTELVCMQGWLQCGTVHRAEIGRFISTWWEFTGAIVKSCVRRAHAAFCSTRRPSLKTVPCMTSGR